MSDPMDATEEKSQPAPAPEVAMEDAAAAPAATAASSDAHGDKANGTSAATTAAPAAAAASREINPRVFWNRLHAIYDQWKKGGKPWGAMPPGECRDEIDEEHPE
jgi:hypothetical protein